MTASRRPAPFPLLLTALLALLALGGALLCSTPAEAQTASRILVSNVSQTGDDSAMLSGNDHAQLFHTSANTGTNTGGWVLTGLTVVAENAEDFEVEICEADTTADEFPTSACTGLLAPLEFAAGNLKFTHSGMFLSANTNYLAVFKQEGTGSVTLDSTTSAGEDSTGLTGWSIKNKFDWDNGGTWQHKGGSNEAIRITVNGYEGSADQDATGRPVIMASAEGAGILYADTSGIADGNGLPFTGDPNGFIVYDRYSYRWVRVDGDTRTNVGADSAKYQPVEADIGRLIEVEVWFTDRNGYPESVTSLPFGPVAEPARSLFPSTLVGNTGQTPSATANITQQYAVGFRLGDHGQGYEISSVSIDLAAAPSSLSVSLWISAPDGSQNDARASRLFDFTSPSSFQTGLNEFTAPAGAFAHQGVNYFIVLSGFGSSLSIKETTSDNEDAGGEPGAVIHDKAAVRALSDTGHWGISASRDSVLRLAVGGSRRAGGILASNYAQDPGDPPLQEIISIGDEAGFGIELGAADRYLIRGVSFAMDGAGTGRPIHFRDGPYTNPVVLRSGSLTGAAQFSLINTRDVGGLPVWTAPQGATVEGGGCTTAGTETTCKEYVFESSVSLDTVRLGSVLARVQGAESDGVDTPAAPGVSLTGEKGDVVISGDGQPYMAVLGEPLAAMVQNLGQTGNGHASLGGTNKVLSQGFTTGSDGFGYRLQGMGVNIEGSGGNVPDGPASVAVAVHADSNGKPGTKLFGLVSPGEFAAGHSFFEAPPGTALAADTTYHLVWSHLGGTAHRLQRTLGDAEDPGKLTGFSIANVFHRGADLDNLSQDSGGNALEIAAYGVPGNQDATGRPVIMASAEGAGILYADTSGIADGNGLPFTGDPNGFIVYDRYSYRWVRVDGDTRTNVGADSAKYQPVEADIGRLIEVEVWFTDRNGYPESVTSLPFGPVAEPARSLFPSTLVGNTGQTPSATANITQQYAVGFRLGDHGQGYEISSVSIDLAAAPSSLSVSLWISAPDGSQNDARASRLFDFTSPSSFQAGLNEFTAPAGAFAHQGVNYFIVLSGFGSSLSIKETASDNEDAGGEPGAVIHDKAAVRALSDTGHWGISASRDSVLRLAVGGSRRAGGILASNYAQDPGDPPLQEIISIGDEAGFGIELGAADRYLIRGVSFAMDGAGTGRPIHFRDGPYTNPVVLRSGSLTGAAQFSLINTRDVGGLPVWTAPQGATVEGGGCTTAGTETTCKEYVFESSVSLDTVRLGSVLARVQGAESDGVDTPAAPGVSLTGEKGDVVISGDGQPYMAVLGEPLAAMVQNLGQTGNGHASLGGTNKVLSQGFTTGSDGFGYRLQGIGVNIEGSGGNVPDGPASVSVAVHADSNGKPGTKLFGLVSPGEFAAGHSFFEAPAGTLLAADTTYHLVWSHLGGTAHRLQRTSSNGQDSGARSGAGIANAYHRGVSTDSVSVDPGGNALQLAVYAEVLTQAPPGVTVSESALGIAEGGSATYTVVLDAQPTDAVTIDVAGGGDVTVDPASLTFTTATWNTPQAVTVRAAEDLDAVDDRQTVTHTVDGDSASEYAGLGVDGVAVTVTDNDTPRVTVSESALGLVEGGSGSYTVVLDAQPSASVTIAVAGGGDVTADPTSLTFTTDTWDTPQTVTVRAAEDADTADDGQTITHTVHGNSAPEYVGLGVGGVAVTVADNDTPGVSVSRSALSVVEGGSGSYTVGLTFQPTAGVTIDVAGGGDVTADPSSLAFSTSTWNTPQTVTVRAAEDADTADDRQTVTHTVDGNSAPEYVGLGVGSVAVTVKDNDAPLVSASFERVAYTVTEGGSVTVRVRLSEDPRRSVTIPLTSTNQGGASSSDYSGVPVSVTFRSGDTVRSFSFTAVQDSVEERGESVRLGFGALPTKVMAGADDQATVSIADANRAPAVSATAEPAAVYPGGTVTLRGIASDPDGDALSFRWSSDGGGVFPAGSFHRETAWVAPATETARSVNLTLTATDPGGLDASATVRVLVEPFSQPDAATDLQGTVSDDNAVSLTWANPGQPRGVAIANVLVQQGNNRGVYEAPTWDTVATLAPSADSHTVEGLRANTTFRFRVRLTTTHGLSGDSGHVEVRTLRGAPAPRHFDAVWPTQTSVTLDWSTVETAAEYQLEYRRQGETEWTRISGDFDHLPSNTDRRQAFGVAAGLDCENGYDFRLSVRGSGDTRNDGDRYPSTMFGAHATTSARTGECGQVERITNLLVSVEPGCATLTWTPPSGGRDTGYRVERYSYTGNPSHRSGTETLTEQANRAASWYQDCSAAYRTGGAGHVYIVTALDGNPGPGEEGAFGPAYTPILAYGPGHEPEGPRNVRLTHDTRFIRGLAWDPPWHPWLSTVRTARAGSGPQQVVTDPWTTGYRVERREYRRTENGDWYLPEVDEETLLTATVTVGSYGQGMQDRGYSASTNPFSSGALSTDRFFYGSTATYTVTSILWVGGSQLQLTLDPSPPASEYENWRLVAGDRQYLFGDTIPIDPVDGGGSITFGWFQDDFFDPHPALDSTVSIELVERESFDWEALQNETDANTGTSYTDSTDKGERQYVYRVWPHNGRGLSHYSFRGDWAFNGGDPGGYPVPAPHVPPPQGQQGGGTPSNSPATGAPTIGGTPQVGETLTASTSDIADADGLDGVSYRYQWTSGGSDIDGATGSGYTLTASEQGQAIQVRVTFTDGRNNAETLTSEATVEVAVAALTASLPDSRFQSARHKGADDRPQVIVAFSTAVASFEKTTSSVSLTGATVSSVRQHEEDGLKNAWIFFLDPDGTDDIVFNLLTGRTCDSGGICTEGGRTLSSAVQANLPGPSDPNSPATGAPTITGTPQVEQTLTADTSGITDQDGLTGVSYGYQWIAGGSDIGGATGSSYTLTASEQGQTIQVRMAFTDDGGNAESLTSIATVAVAAAPNREASGKPAIGGTPQVGETLTTDTANIADQDGLTNVFYRYQWIAGGSDIGGATGSSYQLTASEQGQTIQVRVTFTDDRGNAETLTSIATAAVAAAPEPLTVLLKVAAPATHDGSSEFTFEIEFSEEFGISYATLRDHAFNVTGGSVETAQRTDQPSNIPWLITVKPQGAGDVTIELPATTDCGAAGAICTGDGRKLSNSLSFTVSGPGQ